MRTLKYDLHISLQETNVLGFKGPRKMTIIIPGMNLDHERVDIKPRSVSFWLNFSQHFYWSKLYHWTLNLLCLMCDILRIVQNITCLNNMKSCVSLLRKRFWYVILFSCWLNLILYACLKNSHNISNSRFNTHICKGEWN